MKHEFYYVTVVISFLSSPPNFPIWVTHSIWSGVFSSEIPVALFFLSLGRTHIPVVSTKQVAEKYLHEYMCVHATDCGCAFFLLPNAPVFVSSVGLD